VSGPLGIDVASLLGWGRLTVDGTLGLARVVEAMHQQIARTPFGLGAPGEGRTHGITGLVYRSVRGTARLAGLAAEAALDRIGPGPERAATPRTAALVAALNGVVGDHLAATGNPLAIEMRLRGEGSALALEPGAPSSAIPEPRRRVLVLIHGLCMSDQGWARGGYGPAFARDLGCTPVYLNYNSGAHVSTNGRRLAELLDRLVRTWPVPLDALTIVAHSLGGLVARSACHQAAAAGLAWPARLDGLVFLGTPHHGAPLERGGHWLQASLGAIPYAAPLARLGRLRSAGVTDLRHGSLVDDDWRGRDRFAVGAEPPRPVPLPAGVRCFAVAGCASHAGAVLGDGLVPVRSALGRHRDPRRELAFPESRRWVARGVGHMELLGDAEVYARIRGWLEPARAAARV
jgi:hypothetical protein